MFVGNSDGGKSAAKTRATTSCFSGADSDTHLALTLTWILLRQPQATAGQVRPAIAPGRYGAPGVRRRHLTAYRRYSICKHWLQECFGIKCWLMPCLGDPVAGTSGYLVPTRPAATIALRIAISWIILDMFYIRYRC